MVNYYPLGFQYKQNKAYLDHVSLEDLANEYGTPLYVLSKQSILNACAQFTKPLSTLYPNSEVLYAAKANLTCGIATLVHGQGLSLDVSSGGELFTALKAGVPSQQIYFHGNNKTPDELRLAIKHNITIIVDNLQEVQHIASVNTESKVVNVLIRLKPEIEAHTHKYIKTGQLDSKFGISRDECGHFFKEISQHSWFSFKGIHSHIGSQIFDPKPYNELIDILIPFIVEIKETWGQTVEILNCGGGMGIDYTTHDSAFQIDTFIEAFTSYLKNKCDDVNLAHPKLLLEPGRAIIGPAGITVYTVGAIKTIPGIKTYAFVDGGMADNMRPICYQATYSFDKVTKTGANHQEYSIAGKYCESGDILSEHTKIESLTPGDRIIVFATGAYNYSMSSNYNRNTRPMMVMVDGDRVIPIVKRETYDDLIRLDCDLNV